MAQTICKGIGSCLVQIGENTYESTGCEHNCKPVPCPNFDICKTYRPQIILWCHKGTCLNCAMLLGYLQFSEFVECPICFETKKGVKQVKCDHKVCVDCFKRAHFPPYWDEPSPEFPYGSDVEDEYDSNPDDKKWKDYPLIEKYERDYNTWELEKERKYESEENLRKCPLCRK